MYTVLLIVVIVIILALLVWRMFKSENKLSDLETKLQAIVEKEQITSSATP